MARVAKKNKHDTPNLAVEEKPSKGKAPIKISKPKVQKAQRKVAVQAAFESDEINTKAVEEAKRALAAGELDTPEVIKRAAEQILDSGL